MITTALVVLSLIFPVAIIITYSLGIEHGRDLELRQVPKMPAALDKIVDMIKPTPRGVAYIPSRDPARQLDGKEEDQFSTTTEDEQFDWPKEPA